MAPLDALDDANQYSGSGTLTSEIITIDAIEFRQLRSDLTIQNGELVNRARCNIGDGVVSGRITAELLDTRSIDGTLEIRQLQLTSIAQLLPEAMSDAKGDVSVEAVVQGAWNTLGELSGWHMDGRLQSSRAEWNGQTLSALSTTVSLQESKVRVKDFRCTWADTLIRGVGSIDLANDNKFRLNVNVDEANLVTVASALDLISKDPQLHAVASVRGEIAGSLQPFRWTSQGITVFDELELPALGVDGCRFQWQMNEQGLRVSGLSAKALGGRVTADGTVPFGGKPYRLTGEFSDIESSSLLEAAGNKTELSGVVAGSFAFSGTKIDELLKAELQIQSPAISAFGTDASDVKGSATYDQERLVLQLTGRALDGSFALNGTAIGQRPDLSDLTIEGRIKTQDVQLVALRHLMQATELPNLDGNAQLDLKFKVVGPSLSPTCRGRCVVKNLRWGGRNLASSASAELVLSNDAIRIENVTAQFAEGTASGEITIMRESRNKTFRLTLRNIRARRLAQFGPRALSSLDGRVNLLLEGKADQDWRGRGQLDMSRADLAGMSIQRLRIPFQWAFLPKRNNWILVSRDAHANFARGRVSADLQMLVGRRLDFKCAGRLERISLTTLLRRAPGVVDSVGGTLSAQFRFGGRDVRSLNDVTGRYHGKVVQSRVLMLPILREMAASLGLGALTRKFDIAEMEGRLSRGGVLRLDRVTLANNNLQMDAAGRIWLNGRIDLDVAAHVGEFAVETALEQMLASPLQVLRVASIEQLVQASEFLDRRLLFLNLSGTVRNPTINPRPNQNLDRDTILFFVDQASVQLLN